LIARSFIRVTADGKLVGTDPASLLPADDALGVMQMIPTMMQASARSVRTGLNGRACGI
jgi:hypothetical protein